MIIVTLFILFSWILIAALINNRSFSSVRGSFLNPITMYLLFSVIIAVDFIQLFNNPEIIFFETSFVILPDDVLESYINFAIFNFSFILAAFLSLVRNNVSQFGSFNINFDPDKSFSIFRVVVFLILCLVVVNARGFFDLLSGAITRQILFSNSVLMYVVFSLLIPSFALMCAGNYSNKKRVFKCTAVAVFLILLSGSRGDFLLLGLILLYVLVINPAKMSYLLIFFLTPLAAMFLLISRFIFRESYYHNNIFTFVQDSGGLLSVFFGTTEVSFAEMMVTIDLWLSELNRAPFESFLAGLMFPLPRSVFEFKPFGASAQLTDLLSPNRWEWTRSEIVTTGFGDLTMQFGNYLSFAVFFILSFLWVSIILKISNSSRSIFIFVMPFLLWWMVVFVRADVYNLFADIWAFVLVAIAYFFMSAPKYRF